MFEVKVLEKWVVEESPGRLHVISCHGVPNYSDILDLTWVRGWHSQRKYDVICIPRESSTLPSESFIPIQITGPLGMQFDGFRYAGYDIIYNPSCACIHIREKSIELGLPQRGHDKVAIPIPNNMLETIKGVVCAINGILGLYKSILTV